jgi:hypothetical protein
MYIIFGLISKTENFNLSNIKKINYFKKVLSHRTTIMQNLNV